MIKNYEVFQAIYLYTQSHCLVYINRRVHIALKLDIDQEIQSESQLQQSFTDCQPDSQQINKTNFCGFVASW